MKLMGPDTMNAPWGLDSRLNLVLLACDFFNVNKVAANVARIGKESPNGIPLPLTLNDFLKFLDVVRAFQKAPNALRVARIVDLMVSKGLLLRVGYGGSYSIFGLDDHFMYLPVESDVQRDLFRLVPVLGPEFLYRLVAPGLVHITGTNKGGDAVAGTGLVVHPSYVLTCRHVVSDMTIDENQRFQGREYAVNDKEIHEHAKVDVAAVRVDGPPLTQLKGAIFQSPVVTQSVYTLGYPKLPLLRDTAVTIQQGTVTNESVTSLSGESLFLYSAISRPGNSGGQLYRKMAISSDSPSCMPPPSIVRASLSLPTMRGFHPKLSFRPLRA